MATLHLGDEESRRRVIDTVTEMEAGLECRALGGAILYRAGEGKVPEKRIFADQNLGSVLRRKLRRK